MLKSKLILLFALLLAAECSALDGKWRGNLDMKVAKLSLIFNFSKSDAGATIASMDCPQQNAKGIPLEITLLTADSIGVECKKFGMTYHARIFSDSIQGTFSQNGFRLPLTLEPEQSLLSRRPQTPVPPYPYQTTDTVFRSADGTILAGTLTVPQTASGSRMPVVVMVTGSGPQNRDEEVFEHRPFAVIADYLARNEVASFRYDDRGVASSKGSFQAATIDTFKTDAASALHFVRSFPQFGSAGILGHSEGGTLAILLAAEKKPDFIISLAGAAVPMKDVLIAQNSRMLDRFGIAGAQKEASLRLLNIAFDSIRNQFYAGQFSPLDIDAICKENSLDVPPMVIGSIKSNMQTRNRYFDSLVSLDPTESLKRIACPVLAINGTKDTQVDAEPNLNAIRANVKGARIERMEGLNHLMQHATTGDMQEYYGITETISPDVLTLILNFITL